jgi:hypothetical protein
MKIWSEPARFPGGRYRYARSDGFALEEDGSQGVVVLTRLGDHLFEADVAFRDDIRTEPKIMCEPGAKLAGGDGVDRVVVGQARRMIATIQDGEATVPLGSGRSALLDASDLGRIQAHDWTVALISGSQTVAAIVGRQFDAGQLILGVGRPVRQQNRDPFDARRSNLQPGRLVDPLENFTIDPNECSRWHGGRPSLRRIQPTTKRASCSPGSALYSRRSTRSPRQTRRGKRAPIPLDFGDRRLRLRRRLRAVDPRRADGWRSIRRGRVI